MKRLFLAMNLALSAAILAADAPLATAAAQPSRPNILLIVADDLGYGELSCQGNQQIPTPNIDSIAQNGIRFTSGYVSCPVCSPTPGRQFRRHSHRRRRSPEGRVLHGHGERRVR